MLMQLMQVVPAHAVVASSNSNGFWLLLLGPIAAVGFYTMIYTRYRNTNKRHAYERETSSQVINARGDDAKVGKVRGTRARYIQGNNAGEPRQRLGRGTSVAENQRGGPQ